MMANYSEKGISINNKDNNMHHHHQSNTHHLDQHNHHQNHQQMNNNNNQMMLSFASMMQSSSSSSPPFPASATSFNISGKDGGAGGGGGAYDDDEDELGEYDQDEEALFLYLNGQDHSPQDQRQNSGGVRPQCTLNIFPSQPMHVDPSPTPSKGSSPGLVVVSAAAAGSSGSKRSSADPFIDLSSNPTNHHPPAPPKLVKREGNRKGATSISDQDGRPNTPPADPKTLRRLAQNREAARKSRLRKKAYVQQLESSRLRLTQLEQDIHRARSQGLMLGGNAVLAGDQGLSLNLNSDAALFDMEYARWLEEHHRVMVELRNAVEEELPENELRMFVENCLVHYDQMMRLKNMITKSDVFHIFTGIWKSPAERCFMWMGGFRPSHLIKIIMREIEPMTEGQMMGIYGVQQSTQEAEEALSHGLDALNQSLSETLISDSLLLNCFPQNINNYMSHMALAINKLSTLEGFVRQADNLRQQTLHRVHQILTTRQSARCFLAIGEYFHRLRALSSLWLSRPRHQ
ncbi:hypothetical protein ABFX02_11G005300 [Erythranthe guttata]